MSEAGGWRRLRSAGAAMAPLLVTAAGVALVLILFRGWLVGTGFVFGVHPEVVELLERSLEDQRLLAETQPEESADYRQRFEQISATVGNLRILAENRARIVRRLEIVIGGLLIVALAVGAVVQVARHRRSERRLERVRGYLEQLAAGRPGITVGRQKRDAIGRVAEMIEQTSYVMAADRQRLAALADLQSWQEAARRQAHELRTPLSAASLELRQLRNVLGGGPTGDSIAASAVLDGVERDLERVSRRVQTFTSFARLPEPRLEPAELADVLQEFVDVFRDAWPNLTLEQVEGATPLRVAVDRELIRQVLANLCDNSAQASTERPCRVRLRPAATDREIVIDVCDDGPGVSQELRERLFEPYATSRPVGEGMGLGLAISRKIMLDHGGDLRLLATSPDGTVMRLSLPRLAEYDGGDG